MDSYNFPQVPNWVLFFPSETMLRFRNPARKKNTVLDVLKKA